MNISLDVDIVAVEYSSHYSHRKISVTLTNVEIKAIVSQCGPYELLSEIGEDAARDHFGLPDKE